MTRSHTSAPASASARPAGRGRSPLVAAQVHPGLMHARTRQAVLVGMAVAALAAVGGVHAAESEAVPVSIEGKTFKEEAPVQTQVVTDGVARRVEAGTTANGAPVIVTRLSSRKKDPSADKAEENGQAQASNPAAGADGANGTGNAADAGITYKAKIKPKVVHTRAEDMEPFVIHAVTPHSVSMAWESDPSVVYNISRNGQPIAQVSGGKYVDETVSPGTEYQYSIEPATAAAGASGKPGMSGVIQVRTPDASGSGNVAAKAALATNAVRGRNGPSETIYQHRTFIPDARVSLYRVGNLGCGSSPTDDVQFKGDDRDWSDSIELFKSVSRTVLTLRAEWITSPARLTADIHVSPTTRFVNGKADVRRATPNSDWFRDSASDNEGTYLAAYIHHSIGNPYCAGKIRYEEEVHMWNDGSLSVKGNRRQAPRHEGVMALKFLGDGTTYGPWRLFRLKNEGFDCLLGDHGALGECEYEEYRASHSL